MNVKTLITISLLIISFCSFAQYNPIEQQTVFGNRINIPIEVEMLTKADKIVFVATNNSFYPYHLVINFDFIENLTPEVLFETFIVYPGRKQIFSLTISNREIQPYCRFSYKYSIGDPRDTAILDYPYLLPLKPNKKFDLLYSENKKTLIMDFFKIEKNDTIYCMRKGDITATPNLFYKTERISKKQAVEVRHEDGTVMIYENLNPDFIFVQAGNTVLPGEPIGVIDDNLYLGVKLFSMNKEGSIKTQNINYVINENTLLPFSEKLKGVDFEHPAKIITKEMTKKEIKKFNKKK